MFLHFLPHEQYGESESKSAENVSLQQLSSKVIERIAFGSCAKQWQHQTIWEAVLAEKPDIWLFLGDNIYGDTNGTTAWLVSREQMTGEWNRLSVMKVIIMGEGDTPETTTLEGRLIDQAALTGVLSTLYDLGLPLVSVECLDCTNPEQERGTFCSGQRDRNNVYQKDEQKPVSK